MGYLAAVTALIAVFHDRVQHWPQYLFGCATGVAVICALLTAHARRPDNRALTLLRLTYPLVVSPLIYTTIDGYVLVLNGHFLDAGMNTFEARLYGGHPTLWLSRLVSRPLTEALYAFYISYYFYIVVPPLLLFLARRTDALERFTTTLAAAVYTCYLGFLVVPVLGPQHFLAGQLSPPTLTGYFLVPLQEFLITRGEPLGACFPSAHVAGAWAALLAIRTAWGRTAFRWILVPTSVMTVSVAYTRYHYVTDIIAGLAVALLAHLVVAGLWRRRGRRDAAVRPPSRITMSPCPPPGVPGT